MLRGKLNAESKVNNGTGGQRHAFFAAKPCSFNAIGGVTGTHHVFPSRTKEQGVTELQNHLVCKGASRRTIRDTKGVLRKTVRSANTARKHRALPEVEGLLE